MSWQSWQFLFQLWLWPNNTIIWSNCSNRKHGRKPQKGSKLEGKWDPGFLWGKSRQEIIPFGAVIYSKPGKDNTELDILLLKKTSVQSFRTSPAKQVWKATWHGFRNESKMRIAFMTGEWSLRLYKDGVMEVWIGWLTFRFFGALGGLPRKPGAGFPSKILEVSG